MVAAATLAGLLIAPRWGTAPVDLLYLPPVLAAAAYCGSAAGAGRRPSPRRWPTISSSPRPIARLLHPQPGGRGDGRVLFLVAVVTSRLAGSMRAQARLAAAPRRAQRDDRRVCPAAAVVRRRAGHRRSRRCRAVAPVRLQRRAGEPAATIRDSSPAPRRTCRLTPSDIAAAALTLDHRRAGRPRSPARQSRPTGSSTRSRRTGHVIAAVGLARDDGLAAGRRGPAAAARQSARPGRAGPRARPARDARRASSPPCASATACAPPCCRRSGTICARR